MNTVGEFREMKERGEKITMLTVYDYTMAKIFNNTQIDTLLVGDSLAMVMHGFPSTVHATVELMALHTAAVNRGAPDKFLVTDMPFLSVRKGLCLAMEAVEALVKAGARSVKIEGMRGHEDIISHIVDSGVPVMAHLGLTPQFIHAFGGYKVQGRGDAASEAIISQARKAEELGCFALLLECVPLELSSRISKELSIPTIGIGAGNSTDGQVLVWQDMLGMNDFKPKFLQTYLDGEKIFRQAVNNYCQEVKKGLFPQEHQSYH